MNCPREPEVLDALSTARWSDELHAHLRACTLCGDLVTISTAFREELRDAMRDAPIPPPGLVWWRMQRREREEAARTAARAITLVQASSIAAAIALALTIAGGVSAMSDTWHSWAARTLQFASSVPATPLFFAIAGSLLLAPVAVWFAIVED